MAWVIYGLVVLVVSGVIGMHLGRFREAYTEMTGMMAGMTMGMLNGFVLGYCAGAATNSMFWGNLIGVLLGLSLGAYFGRAGSLMGIMDGAMGGVMGGSMGAMLAVMVVFPRGGLFWTAVLLGAIYVIGMIGLVVLIEQSAPEHAAFHSLLPVFARVVAVEAAEEAERAGRGVPSASPQPRITDYYAFLGLGRDPTLDEIGEAYLGRLATADEAEIELAERAISTLSDPRRRKAYDTRLKVDCCPPGEKSKVKVGASSSAPASRHPLPAADAKSSVTLRVAPQPKQASTHEEFTLPHQPNDPVTVRATSGGTGSADVTDTRGRSARGSGVGPREQNGRQMKPPPDSSSRKQSPSRGTIPRQMRRDQADSQQPLRYPKRRQRAQQRVAPSRPENKVISVPWIGGLLFLLVAGLFGWWALNQSAPAAPTSREQVALEAEAVIAPIEQDGKQTLDLVVNGDTWGYEPNVIEVKLGVPVHINLSSKGADPG
jgi:hypothetical protein